MKKITLILNIIYVLIIVIFLSDELSNLDIKSQTLKSFTYYGIAIGAPLILIWNAFTIKIKIRKIIGILLPITIIVFISITGPVKFVISKSSWRTQTILYQNGHLKFNTIEFQIQDLGAFGHNKRTVEVFYLTPLFMITKEAPKDIDKKIEWIKVDKQVNELEIKHY